MLDRRTPHVRSSGFRLVILLVASVLMSATHRVHGQTRDDLGGSATAAIAGGSLGLLSGAVLGAAASLIPCSQTYAGPRCVRWGVAAAGIVGLTSGLLIGSADEDEISSKVRGSAIGLGVGLVGSLALFPAIDRFGWKDGVVVGLLGTAVGASPKGALIGLGIGSAMGALLWQSIPSLEFPDAAAMSVGGLALGALADWMLSAIDAQSDREVTITFSTRLGF